MPIDCPSAYVVDGDTIRCGSERVRLLGIDAPELHGCRSGRTCVSGDGAASRRSLVGALRFGRVRYTIITRDRYGRAVSQVWAGSTDLSCYQAQRSQAVYKPRWDTGAILRASCRTSFSGRKRTVCYPAPDGSKWSFVQPSWGRLISNHRTRS